MYSFLTLLNLSFYLCCCCFYFSEKYDQIGRLLKPGQEPVDYTDSEEEISEERKDEKLKNQ